ncbi:MAG TPA: cation-translocating P-type ATPase [Stellaceae bacterium]|nr:cation-translocating P-type ATPase [Stellaceae bacterium]
MRDDAAATWSGGLTKAEAAARLAAEGANLLPRPESRSFFRIVGEVLREPMFALLLGAGAVYVALGDLKEAVILFLFACTSVGIAVVQEARTERVLESLRDLTSPRALVVRDGIETRIAGSDVVRGDLVILAEGDRVPADAIVISAHDLMTDESLLTGESAPVRKRHSSDVTIGARPGGDDLPYVFSASLVVRGRGRAVVTATGARSEIGKIGVAMTGIEADPPRLQAETGRLVRRFAMVSLSLAVLTVPLYGLLRGGWLDAVLSGIALGMSMLPEEFPLVLTVFMVMGAWRISRARVLTRRVSAIETLGAATVLCTDKTGTLTQNRMTIVELRAGEARWSSGSGAPTGAFAGLVRCGILASAREPFDPMEKAFYALGQEVEPGADVHAGLTLKREYGLRPDLLAVTNIWQCGSQSFAAAKGAPETIAELCGLAPTARKGIAQTVDELAGAGMRVLGVARAALPADRAQPETPRGLPFRFLGLVGLADPLRPTVPEAVKQCRTAGIRVVMITGDYLQTARAIAAQAGLDDADIVTGADLEVMSEAELAARARTATVFARTMPEQKLRIVRALKANGEVVAMTGDGVNDAPSLKVAHIGIAMGGRGTDVAREASSLVLLDDDFASIVGAVRLGRRIYDNLRKAMAYLLAIHVPIAGLVLVPLVFGLPLIFWPLHIAFLELVIDPMCSIVFEAEREASDIMRRPPRDPGEPLFDFGYIAWSLGQGVIVWAFLAGLYVLTLHQGLPEADARALTFATLVVTNLGLVLLNRARGERFWAGLRRRNGALWWATGATAAVLTAILAIEPARQLFHFGPLHPDDVAVAAASGILVLMLLALPERIARRRQQPREGMTTRGVSGGG